TEFSLDLIYQKKTTIVHQTIQAVPECSEHIRWVIPHPCIHERAGVNAVAHVIDPSFSLGSSTAFRILFRCFRRSPSNSATSLDVIRSSSYASSTLRVKRRPARATAKRAREGRPGLRGCLRSSSYCFWKARRFRS